MVKPTAKSTVVQMRQYIRDNKLNKQPIRLGMKRAELITHLRKMGHYDSKHDKPSAKVPAPKAVPKPAPKRKVLKKAQEVGGEGSGVMPNPPLPKKKAPANFFVEVDIKEFDKARAEKARAPKAVPKPAPKRKVIKKAPAKDTANTRGQIRKDLGKLLPKRSNMIQYNTKDYPQFGTYLNIPAVAGDRITLKDVETKIKEIKEALSKELLDQFSIRFISNSANVDASLTYDFKTDTIIENTSKKKKARK